MYTLAGELAQKFSVDLIVVPIASRACWGIFMLFPHDGAIVYEGLEILSIITLKHELQLLPAFVAVVSLISLFVKGIKVIKCPGIEGFPVCRLVGGVELEVGASQQLFWQEAIAT